MLTYLSTDWELLDPYWQRFFTQTCWLNLIDIDNQLLQINKSSIIYPPRGTIFSAFEGLTPATIKVVILGQDPYHGENEANGLAFAVNENVKIPPSLRNIFKELLIEFNQPSGSTFDSTLKNWKQQGVLLLNSSLTVIKDQPNSLSQIGWHTVTDLIIQHISLLSQNCVFMLWGNYARTKKNFVDKSKHLILESVHPSPLSANRGFFGCDHFKKANLFLAAKNHAVINWL